METVIIVDTLRRGGIEVTLAGVSGADSVVCSRKVKIVPDVGMSQIENESFDAVIVPGGLKGAEECATVTFVIEMKIIIIKKKLNNYLKIRIKLLGVF